MTMRTVNWMTLTIALVAVLQTTAFADTIEGRVAGTTSQGIDMTVYDPQGRPYPNNLHLKTDYRTQFSGVSSGSALRRGDPISAEVNQEEGGAWLATQINLFQEMNVRPATQNPPPSMRNILGNPVVKGALLGAATGAIASSASGGKAGKGALIGAGVGAAGGLLGQLLGGGSQQSSDDNSSQ